MGLFIRQCCVCNKRLGVEVYDTFTGTRISHGYCESCAEKHLYSQLEEAKAIMRKHNKENNNA